MLEIVTSIRAIDKSNLDCGVLFPVQLITFGTDEMKAYLPSFTVLLLINKFP